MIIIYSPKNENVFTPIILDIKRTTSVIIKKEKKNID